TDPLHDCSRSTLHPLALCANLVRGAPPRANLGRLQSQKCLVPSRCDTTFPIATYGRTSVAGSLVTFRFGCQLTASLLAVMLVQTPRRAARRLSLSRLLPSRRLQL